MPIPKCSIPAFRLLGNNTAWQWSCFIAGVGLLIAGLGFFLLGKLHHPWVLEVRMESSRSSTAQLFYSTDGRGFRESASVLTPVHGERTLAFFDLPPSQVVRFELPLRSIQRLRFDPLRDAGTFTVESIRLVDGGGRVLESIPREQWMPYQQIALSRSVGEGVFYATEERANDPVILLELKGAVSPPLMARLVAGAWIFGAAGAILLLMGGWESRQRLGGAVGWACARYELPLALLVIAAGALARSFDRFIHPHLWAEDGTVYLADAMQWGWRSLFMPFADLGYLNTIQRLEALAVVQWFPLEWVPLGFTLAAVLNAGVLCWSIRRAFPTHPAWVRLFLYGMVFFVFNWDDMFNSLANSQWYLGAALLLTVCWRPPQRLRARWLDWGFIVLLGLSGPYAVPFIPIYALRILLGWDWGRTWPYAVSWAIPAIIQAGVYWFSPRSAGHLPWDMLFDGAFDFLKSIAPVLWLSMLLWAWLAFLLWKAWRSRSSWREVWMPTLVLGAGCVAIVESAILATWGEVIGLPIFGERTRYSYIPFLGVYGILFMLSTTERTRIGSAILLLLIVVPGFRSHHHNDSKWDVYVRYAQIFPADKTLMVPVHPVWPSYPAWHSRLGGEGKGEMPRVDLLGERFWAACEQAGLTGQRLGGNRVVVTMEADYPYLEWCLANELGDHWPEGVLEVEIEGGKGCMLELEIWFLDGGTLRRQWSARYVPPHTLLPLAFRGVESSRVALRLHPQTGNPMVLKRADLCFTQGDSASASAWTPWADFSHSTDEVATTAKASR